jgi:hypothetical protein
MSETQDVQVSSKNINSCHPSIIKAFPIVCEAWKAVHGDMDLKVDWCYRTPADQMELFKLGRVYDPVIQWWRVADQTKVVTQDDGTTNKSHHNVFPSQAADIYITQEGKILWGENAAELDLYCELGRLW